MNQFVYHVNEEDRITFVDRNWLLFGKENGLPNAGDMVGCVLWNHITDLTTRHLYNVFMSRVRETGSPVIVPFRCDSPTALRSMELHIRRRPKCLEFQTFLLREERRERKPAARTPTTGNHRPLTMCIWCKRMKASMWLATENAVRQLRLFDLEKLPMISHGVCPSCEAMGRQAVIA